MRARRPNARLIVAASDTDANMLWATRLFAPDPFIFIQKGARKYLVMSDLEVDRAKDQASVDRVLRQSDSGGAISGNPSGCKCGKQQGFIAHVAR